MLEVLLVGLRWSACLSDFEQPVVTKVASKYPGVAVPTAKEVPVILRLPKARVLVVDDDKRLADSLALVLAQHGFSVSAAYGGSEAVESALKSRPDFIVMDVMMIGIDGVDAAIAICETLPRCRILLMSGAEDAVKRLDKGSRRGHRFELLMKPVLTASLLDKLQSLPPVYRDGRDRCA